MYMPPHFAETDPDAIAGLIAAYPLATVIATTPDGILANHLPLLRAPDGDLIGHVALANDMHRLIAEGQQVLAIFRGEDAYVTPNAYPSKAEHHKAVPTWNYRVAHVHGPITFSHAEHDRRVAVAMLTRDHERRVNGGRAWKMAEAPADFIAGMLQGIVAFRIVPLRVIAKAKMSQNRSAEDREGVAANMRARGETAMAEALTRSEP
ncbi:FMN-binding negative transcriptional regulator [Szabonella alba]|uniref:FMN-binding negative transcriptional regulator n=1 Tax=Szabonella alba TaxID=2804194 RepID=A0A8K0V948_9RHOB|nr:FMN-binding negative transcriptional regulator [Szabonella alba]MBL4917633.1 FMN-binding negative transcriptional regulator [Szabonella alba]